MAREGYLILDSDLHMMEPDDLWVRYLDEPCRSSNPPRFFGGQLQKLAESSEDKGNADVIELTCARSSRDSKTYGHPGIGLDTKGIVQAHRGKVARPRGQLGVACSRLPGSVPPVYLACSPYSCYGSAGAQTEKP